MGGLESKKLEEFASNKGEDMTGYVSDYLDEACTQMYGHTNWEYGDGDASKVVVIFHKEPLDEEEDYDD